MYRTLPELLLAHWKVYVARVSMWEPKGRDLWYVLMNLIHGGMH